MNVAFDRIAKQPRRVAILAHKLSRPRKAQVYQIVKDQNLPVAFGP